MRKRTSRRIKKMNRQQSAGRRLGPGHPVQLDDIELTNENLLELRWPNERVNVGAIEPVQLNLFDMQAHRSGRSGQAFQKQQRPWTVQKMMRISLFL